MNKNCTQTTAKQVSTGLAFGKKHEQQVEDLVRKVLEADPKTRAEMIRFIADAIIRNFA